jgi:hypothetical protein
VADARLIELLALDDPTKLLVETHGVEACVAEQLRVFALAKGIGLELDHEHASDALALTLRLDCHLHELALPGRTP